MAPVEDRLDGNPGTDPALKADWPAICRRMVERQQVLFDETPPLVGRDRY